jgi:hypothetical protein
MMARVIGDRRGELDGCDWACGFVFTFVASIVACVRIRRGAMAHGRSSAMAGGVRERYNRASNSQGKTR